MPVRLIALCLAAVCALPTRAQSPVPVDVELFLAVDVSRSMSPRELEIQRRGYAEALVSREVVDAITSGIHGKIALTYVEWAGERSQRVIVPWTEVASEADARAIAERLTAHFDPSLRRTSISGAIRYAADSLQQNRFQGLRRVIDISGDGPNNQGPVVTSARDEAVAQGVVINGLPLMTRDGIGARWHLDDLDEYYRQCVVGGPGAFVIPVLEWAQFPAAVRQKLVLELADKSPDSRVWKAQAKAGYDCLIGEKMWEQLQERYFLEP